MANELTAEQKEALLETIHARFEKHMDRHPEVSWDTVAEKLEATPSKLWSLYEMERTEGEPDIVVFAENPGKLYFVDCAPESPKGRRSVCYDQEALDKRKANKPANSAVNMASQMGIELLTEDRYHELQQFGPFDAKTSSWVLTPENVRKLGGAIFCDYRYGRTFTYHNGAESYYAARAFRGILEI